MEHVYLPFRFNGGVYHVEGVLLEVNGVDKVALQEDYVVFDACAFFADNLHHLLNLGTAAHKTVRVSDFFRVDDPLVF